MHRHRQFYIDGEWRAPETELLFDVIDPATEQPYTAISLGASAIVGATRPEQLDENARAAGATVAPELFAQGERILADAGAVES